MNEHGRTVSTTIKAWSKRVLSPDQEKGWQNQLSLGMLRSVFAVATVGIAYFCYHAYRDGSFWVIPFYVVAYLVLFLAAFWRRFSYGAQASVLVFLIYGLAIVDLIESGRPGDGRVFLLAAPLLATLLFGRRAGIVALAFNVILMAVFGAAFVNGTLDLPVEKQLSYASASSWGL